MEILLGLLIITIGSIGVSSSYIPINKIKEWSWENFWMVQGIFAWIVFPFLGALLAVSDDRSLCDIWSQGGALPAVIYGVLWGVGGLTFGLGMRYLGVALGQSIGMGTCSAFGTILPPLLAGSDLFHGKGLLLLIGVSIMIAGIAIIGYAGCLRNKNMSEEEKRAAIKDFALTKGLLVAFLAGAMSACFNLGLESGAPMKDYAIAAGCDALFAGLPVIFLVTIGGFCTNAAYCVYQNIKNKTGGEYLAVTPRVLMSNILFCTLAGVLWYSQFFGLETGKSFIPQDSTLYAFSWSILMSLNVIASNVWGIILKEWKGAGMKTIAVLLIGLAVLIASIVVVSIAQQ